MKAIVLALALALPLAAEFASPSRSAKAYHASLKCVAMLRVKEPQKLTPKEAQARGLRPCGNCYRAKKGAANGADRKSR
jgi:hypothetical protein